LQGAAKFRELWSRLPKRGRKTSVGLVAVGVAVLVELSVVLGSAARPSHENAAGQVLRGPRPVLVSSKTTSRSGGHSGVIVGHSYKNDATPPLRQMHPVP